MFCVCYIVIIPSSLVNERLTNDLWCSCLYSKHLGIDETFLFNDPIFWIGLFAIWMEGNISILSSLWVIFLNTKLLTFYLKINLLAVLNFESICGLKTCHSNMLAFKGMIFLFFTFIILILWGILWDFIHTANNMLVRKMIT